MVRIPFLLVIYIERFILLAGKIVPLRARRPQNCEKELNV